MLVTFRGLKFDLPQGWADITDDVPGGGPPSLARPDGVGVLQFTFAKYQSGENPNITVTELREFLNVFFSRNKMPYGNVIERSGRMISVQGASDSDDEFILARYFSNGKDVALATYVCSDASSAEAREDLRGVEVVMESIEF